MTRSTPAEEAPPYWETRPPPPAKKLPLLPACALASATCATPPAGATLWLKQPAPHAMTRTPQVSAWDEAQRIRDIEIADWFIWAASQRIQQASREMAIHSYELNYFEDSFALQLAQLQQHVRTTPMRRRQRRTRSRSPGRAHPNHAPDQQNARQGRPET